MAPTNSLRECLRPFGADLSRGIRIVMQSAGETSVRALCSRPTGAFHIVALGDSVMWGQGLSWNKFARLVAMEIESWLFYRDVHEPHIVAHSGATLSGREYGEKDRDYGVNENHEQLPPQELPLGYPSIPKQLEIAESRLRGAGITPDQVQLVLLNGGINDVGLFTILSPHLDIDHDTVRLKTQQVMEQMRTFLPTVLAKFKYAKVVIPNYFQIISTDSSIAKIGTLMFVLFDLPGVAVTAYLRNELDKQSEAFNLEWTSQMSSIIEELRTTRPELDPDRICLVDVQFSGTNAYGADHSYLWEVAQIGFEIVTQDQVEDERIRQCEDAETKEWGPDLPIIPYRYCGEAAMGHPNTSGASKYRYSIMNCIRSRGWLEEWRGGPWTPTFLDMSASMEPMPQEEGWLGQWTGKIIAREIQPPHSPVRATVVISRNGEVIKRVPTDTEFSWTFSRRIIIDKKPHIQTDSVIVQAPYTKDVRVVSGGTRPADI